ncbi:glycosyl transferase family 2 [Shewanella sp. GutCb]|uniref:glycosyltransferase family 2 protein n=1 Tax=Shewanella sp. GutCb TaxID=2058315 RepID=UPI000C7C6125|nr:glycosyltransferase [Shewanella sp. GutCb]PKG75764.1 glycosyl transferase family 2 [Shewanella sp. GutCb]
MDTPLISIIVPVYNVEEYLDKCLTSLIEQSYQNLEIICINDGSPDNSQLILDRYAKLDSRIIVISQTNQGVSAARNAGLSRVTGDFTMFVDPDDWLDLDCCRIVIEIALKNDYDVVFWPYNKFFSERIEKQFVYNENIAFDNKVTVKKGVFKDLLGPSNLDLKRPHILDAKVTVHCKLYKSGLMVERISFVDLNIIGSSEDLLFNLQVFNNVESAYFLNTPLYNYLKTNENSITTVYKPNLLKQWEKLHEYIRNSVDLDDLVDEYKNAFSNRIACSIIGLGLNELSKRDSFFNTRSRILAIVSDKKYSGALNKITTVNMPLHWKLFFRCAKFKLVTPLTLLYFVIHRIILR